MPLKLLPGRDLFRQWTSRHRAIVVAAELLVVFALGFLAHRFFFAPATPEGPADGDREAVDHEGHRAGLGGGMPERRARLRQLTISPEARALMNIQTTRVERRYVTNVVRMVGKIDYDETRLKYITARVAGRLDRLFVDYTGIEVKQGEHLVWIYSEELNTAQQELIEAVKTAGEGGRPELGGIDLLESAREKLRLLGLTEEQISQFEKQDKPSVHLTIYAPMTGTVIEKLRQEGDRVSVGERIYRLADLSEVWVMMDAYESDHMWLRYGQTVTFTTEAYPGETFEGQIAFIDPVINEKTRTAKVRVNLPNEHRKLKPEMFVHGEVRAQIATGGRVIDPSLAGKWIGPMHPEVIRDEPGKCPECGMDLVTAESLGYFTPVAGDEGKPLVIPASAALVTGTRAIVYVEVPDAPQPTYQGREIVLGPRASDFFLVKHGLREGELVVTRGNFKIDSAIQIEAKPSMMTPEGGGGGGMHQHGGEEEMKPTAAEAPPMEIPAPFRKQLRQLDEAYRAVKTAVESGDPERVRLAFRLLGESLKDVDADLVEGHPRMLWDDLQMLLANDVVIGSEVTRDEEARQVFGQLTEHVERMRKQLLTAAMQGEHAGH